MRNIKFRVWNRYQQKFVIYYDEVEAYQWTGKVDIHGVDIYEGDKVKSSIDDDIRVIEWCSEEASFKARCLPNEKYCEPLYMHEAAFEIIGNICSRSISKT